MEVLPGIFNMTSCVCMCKSYCFFFVWGGGSLFFVFLVPKYQNIGIFEDLRSWFSAFWGQKSRVNNLATYKQ